MMKSLQDHLSESQHWIDNPAVGDNFAINIREECLLESHIITAHNDAIVIEADAKMISILEQYGMLDDQDAVDETIRRYGAVGSSAGMGYTLGEYGGAQKPGVMDRPQKEPPVDLDPEAVGNMRELPDGTRQKRTHDGWKTIAGPNPSRPRAIKEGQLMQRILELAGMARMTETAPSQPETNAAHTDPLAAKAADLAPVGTMNDPATATTVDESVMSGIDMDLRHIAKTERMDALVDAMRGEFGIKTQQYLQDMMDDVDHNLERRGMSNTNMQTKLRVLMDTIRELYAQEDLDEDENRRGLDHAYAVYGNRQGYYAWRKSPPSPVLNIGITDPQLTGLTDWDPRSPEIQGFVKQHMKPVNFNSLSAGIKKLILRELPLRKQGMSEGAMSGIDIDLQQIARDPDLLYDAFTGKMGRDTERWLVDMFNDVSIDNSLHPDDQQEEILEIMMDHIMADYGDDLDEAKYQGREVPLGKPMQGDVAKFKVYVKDPKTGNVKKVNFGDKSMRIKKSNPARRRSFRARHRCENPGPKTKARYWACRKW